MSCDISLYVIIDPEHCNGRDIVEISLATIRGGASIIQYRDKVSTTRELIHNANKLKQAIEKYNIPLIINDRVDVALASDADGVHLGQSDMHPNDARRILGAHKIIGLTIKTREQAQETGTLPIDYACIGGVFTTTSKQNVEPPLGLSGLNERVKIIRKVAPNLKIGAIAGINASNAASVMQQDIDGVAVLSAITMAHDVERDTLRLHAILNKKT